MHIGYSVTMMVNTNHASARWPSAAFWLLLWIDTPLVHFTRECAEWCQKTVSKFLHNVYTNDVSIAPSEKTTLQFFKWCVWFRE